MDRSRYRTAVFGIALAFGLTVTATIAGTGAANGDGDAYIKKLTGAGINTPRGDYELKEWGYAICELRKRGFPPKQWATQGVWNSAMHPPYGFTETQANFIVDTAVSELCDDRDGPPPWVPLP